MPPPGSTLAHDLRHLHEMYISKVNAAVADDRPDLVSELAAEFADDAQRTITAAEPPSSKA